MEKSPPRFINIGQHVLDAIFVTGPRTRCQCIQHDQIQTVEDNGQHNFPGLIVAFSLWIIFSRLAAKIWSDRHQKRNRNSLPVTIREKE
jgi:hypothetical protein